VEASPDERTRTNGGTAMTAAERHRRLGLVLLAILTTIAVGAALHATRPVTLPLTFGLVLAMLVHPVQAGIERRTPTGLAWLGTAAASLVVLAAALAFLAALWLCAEAVAAQAPDHVERLQAQWRGLLDRLRGYGLPIADGPAAGGELAALARDGAASVLRTLGTTLAFAVLIVFVMLLALLEIGVWRDKLDRALPSMPAFATADSVAWIARQVRRFVLVRAALGVLSGVLAGAWLGATGVALAFVWGFLHFLLNFVPNIGSIIAGGLATLFALSQLGLWWGLLVGAGLLAIEQAIGNFLDPKLQGRALEISPLVVLVAVVFWSWAWGPAGALLAMPLTVTLLVTCAHVPALRPLALLLSRTTDERRLIARTHGDELRPRATDDGAPR
jgi:AI-2 transport protein TqsA